jgi:hypothetical protein
MLRRTSSLLRSVDHCFVILRDRQRMQGTNPFAGYQPYETDSDESESSSGSSSSEESEEHDARMSSLDAWRAQGQAWLAGPSRYTVPEGPGRADNRLGMWNTAFEYAEERRVSVLMLDSLDRDQAAYPLPTSLRLKLPRVYRNVERIDICQVKFLNGLYAISDARENNRLWFDIGDGDQYIDISDGTYTGQQLVDALAAALGAYGITIEYNCTAGRFVISAGAPFTLPWRTYATNTGPTDWGLGWNLGFGGPATDMSGELVYMASHMPRLFDDYVFLRLNDAEKMNDVDHTDLENVALAQDSTGQVGHYFGKLLLNNFGCWSQTFIEAPKRFRPVLGRLERLNVDWVDRHGVPLTGADAATCDWHMTVRITEIVEGPSVTSSLAMSRSQQQNSVPTGRGQ